MPSDMGTGLPSTMAALRFDREFFIAVSESTAVSLQLIYLLQVYMLDSISVWQQQRSPSCRHPAASCVYLRLMAISPASIDASGASKEFPGLG